MLLNPGPTIKVIVQYNLLYNKIYCAPICAPSNWWTPGLEPCLNEMLIRSVMDRGTYVVYPKDAVGHGSWLIRSSNHIFIFNSNLLC